MFTIQQIATICANNGFQQFSVTMTNGDKLIIIPCMGYADIKDMNNIEYWLVEGPLPYMGCDTVEKLVTQLNNYEKLVQNANVEKEKLKKFFDEHISGKNADDNTQSFYSDWHKDVFGFRPRHNCFGIPRYNRFGVSE